MKKNSETTQNYINNLEDKIVELGLKLKLAENELSDFQNEELKLFKKFTHNLKNPIGNIMSFSNIILESKHAITPDKQQKYLEIIQNSSNFSLELMNSFNEYFSLKNQKEKLELSKVNLQLVILKEIERLKNWALARNIIMEFEYENENIYIVSNERSLGNIINKLIHNAIRFSKNDSKVIVRLEQSFDKVEISIVDKGIGISEENLLKVFKCLFVCNTYDLAKTRCIGLGLSISKILTERLSGKLQVKSELNKGAIASLSFEKE